MDTGERLAALLSGDLDTDETAALEADLARDPALRARLERIRAADEALAALAAEDVALPDGFHDRLQDRLAPELDAVLGDELAARRARRALPAWLPAVGAAAALAAVIGIGVVSLDVGDGDDAATVAGDDALRTMSADSAPGMPEAAELNGDGAAITGPTVVDDGRVLDENTLAALADDPRVRDAIAAMDLEGDPAARSDDYAAAFGAPSAGETTDAAAGTAATTPLVVQGDVTAEDLEAVAACIEVLFEDAPEPVVPLYAELGTAEDGTPVIAYVAIAPDADGTYERVEVWLVARDTCDLLRFTQAG